MIFLFTIVLGWWNYDESKFQEIFDNSWNRPIYAICYSQNCPHCVGIPSRFKMFSQSMANNDEIIYTAIDIGNSTACQKLGARYVPYFIFARGTNKKYWLRPQFNCPLRWMEFVSDWGSPKVIKINNDSNHKDINEHIHKTLNGGSTFYLQTPKDNPVLGVYTNLSTKYHIYNDTFIYSESNEPPKLTVFTSTNCSQVYDVDSQSIIKIIKDNRFSSHHHLDIQEWSKMTKSKLNSVIFMNDGELNGTRSQILDDISNQYCNDAHFGWANLKDEKAISIKLQQKENEPYIAAINRKNDCQFIKKIESSENTDSINNFILNSFSSQKGKDKCTHYVAAENPKEANDQSKKYNDKEGKNDSKAPKYNNAIKKNNQIENQNTQSQKFSIKTIIIIAFLFITIIALIAVASYRSNMNEPSDTEAKIE